MVPPTFIITVPNKGLLRGVHPERKYEILRFARNRRRRAHNDKLIIPPCPHLVKGGWGDSIYKFLDNKGVLSNNSPHNEELCQVDEAEIKDVIHTGFSIPTKYNRIGKAKVYDFKQNRHNKYYEQKRVEVFYLIEGDKIITVTVYVFYGKWEV